MFINLLNKIGTKAMGFEPMGKLIQIPLKSSTFFLSFIGVNSFSVFFFIKKNQSLILHKSI